MGQVSHTGHLNQHFYYDNSIQLWHGTDSQQSQSERTEIQLQFNSLRQYLGCGITIFGGVLSTADKI